MTIQEITEENIEDYINPVPAEFISEIKREHCSGLAAEDEGTDETAAVMFWELKNVEEDSLPTEAEILWFSAKNKKGGEKLLKAFEENAANDEVERVVFELPVLSDEEQFAFLQAGYAVHNAESRDITVTVGELSALKLSKKPLGDYILPLSELSSRQFKSGIMTSVFHGKYGLLEDLPFLPMTRFDPDVSCCVQTDEKVNGYLLVHKNTSGISRVELLFAMQPDANVHLLEMMRFSIQVASKYRPPEEKVILRRHNDATRQLISKLFPGKKGEEVMKGERRIENGL